jgi:uncharacterized small protein (DUF1192 family)
MVAALATFVPVLKPVAKKSAKKDALVLLGHEETAARVRDRAREIETLEAEQKQDAAALIEASRVFRREAEAEGNFHKTVKVATATDDTISLVFSDRYSPVAVENEDALRDCLGSQYDAMFRRECKVSQRKDMNLEALKALLGDKFDAFASAFDVKEVLVPVDGFMETRANLRPSLSAELNATVDGIVDQVQFKPSVRTK